MKISSKLDNKLRKLDKDVYNTLNNIFDNDIIFDTIQDLVCNLLLCLFEEYLEKNIDFDFGMELNKSLHKYDRLTYEIETAIRKFSSSLTENQAISIINNAIKKYNQNRNVNLIEKISSNRSSDSEIKYIESFELMKKSLKEKQIIFIDEKDIIVKNSDDITKSYYLDNTRQIGSYDPYLLLLAVMTLVYANSKEHWIDLYNDQGELARLKRKSIPSTFKRIDKNLRKSVEKSDINKDELKKCKEDIELLKKDISSINENNKINQLHESTEMESRVKLLEERLNDMDKDHINKIDELKKEFDDKLKGNDDLNDKIKRIEDNYDTTIRKLESKIKLLEDNTILKKLEMRIKLLEDKPIIEDKKGGIKEDIIVEDEKKEDIEEVKIEEEVKKDEEFNEEGLPYFGNVKCCSTSKRSSVCSNLATYEYEGKYYCGIHCKAKDKKKLPKKK